MAGKATAGTRREYARLTADLDPVLAADPAAVAAQCEDLAARAAKQFTDALRAREAERASKARELLALGRAGTPLRIWAQGWAMEDAIVNGVTAAGLAVDLFVRRALDLVNMTNNDLAARRGVSHATCLVLAGVADEWVDGNHLRDQVELCDGDLEPV